MAKATSALVGSFTRGFSLGHLWTFLSSWSWWRQYRPNSPQCQLGTISHPLQADESTGKEDGCGLIQPLTRPWAPLFGVGVGVRLIKTLIRIYTSHQGATDCKAYSSSSLTRSRTLSYLCDQWENLYLVRMVAQLVLWLVWEERFWAMPCVVWARDPLKGTLAWEERGIVGTWVDLQHLRLFICIRYDMMQILHLCDTLEV